MAVEPENLDLIPRSVRDKLDLVGIKLHLKEWQQLSLAERAFLRDAACGDGDAADVYRRRLEEMVHAHTGRVPQRLAKRTA